MQIRIFTALLYKELQDFFATNFSYLYFATFTLILGIWIFYFGNILTHKSLTPMFLAQANLYLAFLPMLTMNLWHKDRQTNILEWLLTTGATSTNLVLAKYVFLLIVSALQLTLTLPVFLSLSYLTDLNLALSFVGYFACILLASAILAFAQFIALLAKNQASAYIASLLGLIFLWSNNISFIKNFFNPYLLSNKIWNFSFSKNFIQIIHGNITLGSIMFYLAFIALFLTLTIKLLDGDKFRL